MMELEDKQTGIEYFETLIRYIFNARVDMTKETANEIIRKIENTYPEGSEIVMTLAEKFREEGREEGLEKGKANTLVKTAIKLLTKKFGILPKEVTSKISELDNSTLEIIIDGIFEYKTLDDVKKYIG